MYFKYVFNNWCVQHQDITIKPEPGAEMVNPYNGHLLRAWRANMDVQVVSSVYILLCM